MKQLALFILLITGGLFAWLLGTRLSPDALGMAVGLVFGVLAGVPTSLLVLASSRRRPDDDEDRRADERRYNSPHLAAPPVIVIASPHPQQWPGSQLSDGYPAHPALPGPDPLTRPAPERNWRVTGEPDGWLDEW